MQNNFDVNTSGTTGADAKFCKSGAGTKFGADAGASGAIGGAKNLKGKKFSKAQKDFLMLIILSSLCLLFFMSAILGVVFASKKNALKTSEMVLLSSQKINDIFSVTLSKADDAITLQKTQNNDWFGIKDDMTFFVDNAQLGRFFDSLTKKQTFYELTSKKNLYKDYNITDAKAFRILVKKEDGTILGDIYFGDTNFNETKRTVRSGNNMRIYYIDDNMYYFLHTDTSHWANMSVVPQKLSERMPNDVVAIFINGLQVTHLDKNQFEEYLQTLKNARSSRIVSTALKNNTNALSTLSINCVNETFTFDFYKTLDGYACFWRNAPFNSGVEFSEWTYKRLMLQDNL